MGKIYGNKVPTVTLGFEYGSNKVWKKWTEKKLITELTKLLDEKTKSEGRAMGYIRITYAKDPQGDYYTRFNFYDTQDCIRKLKPSIEKELLRWFYETDS